MRVIIESPYAGATPQEARKFRNYLRRAVLDSLAKFESPFASHGFYTQFLDDAIPAHRVQGMNAGFDWMEKAQLVAVYADYGISEGMQRGIRVAAECKIPTSFRYIIKGKMK